MEKRDGKVIEIETSKESYDLFEEMDSKMKEAVDFKNRPNEMSGQHNPPEMGSISKKMEQTDDDDDDLNKKLTRELKLEADNPVLDVGSEDDHVKMGSIEEINQSGQSSDVLTHGIEKGKDVDVSGGDCIGSETETETETETDEELENRFHICRKCKEVAEVREKVDEAYRRFIINSVLGEGGSFSRYVDVDAGDDVKIEQPGEISDFGIGSEGNGDEDVAVSGESQDLNKQGDVKNDLGKIADDLEHEVSTDSEED